MTHAHEARAHAYALAAMSERVVAEALGAARAAGVDAHGHVARERPVDLLLRLADEHYARLVVVGSYGEPAALLLEAPQDVHRDAALREERIDLEAVGGTDDHLFAQVQHHQVAVRLCAAQDLLAGGGSSPSVPHRDGRSAPADRPAPAALR